jgi:dTDP-4-dehydrorhamnose reductase
MRILITGASGQVGGALAAQLGFAGEIVPAARALLDLSRPDGLGRHLDAIQPDFIINAAAYTAVDKAEEEQDLAFRINAQAAGVLGRWAHEKRIPMVHFSTDYVFGGAGEQPFLEDAPVNPLSAYGESKAEGERLLLESGAACLIIRTSWVYAAKGKNFLRTIASLARERDSLRVVSDQIGAPTSAKQIADCVAAILNRDGQSLPALFGEAQNLVHFCASGVTSWHGFACAIVEGLRRRGVVLRAGSIEPIPSSEYPAAAKRPANSRLDTGRIQKIFGIRITSWQNALERELDLLAEDLKTQAP